MSEKLKKLENIILLILAIILILFIFDGNKLYSLPKHEVAEDSETKIGETVIDAKNIELETTKKINNSYLYLYKVDDRYASLIYNRSLFYNRYELETATYNINLKKNFTESFFNYLYTTIYSINKNNDEIIIKNNKEINRKFIQKIIFILVTAIICIVAIRKMLFSKIDNENNNI